MREERPQALCNQTNQLEGTCHDLTDRHQPRLSAAPRNRPRLCDGGLRQTGLGSEASWQQSDVVVKNIAEDKRKDAAPSARCSEGGFSSFLSAGRGRAGDRCADRRHGPTAGTPQGSRCVDSVFASPPDGTMVSELARTRRKIRRHEVSIRAAIDGAICAAAAGSSMPIFCLRDYYLSPSTP